MLLSNELASAEPDLLISSFLKKFAGYIDKHYNKFCSRNEISQRIARSQLSSENKSCYCIDLK